jgi:ubiquinone/menaquinone biosynthesis C-methylase UbiE
MSTSSTDTLPDYAPMMAAYHRGFAAELKHMINGLPIKPGMRVLDMACGEGIYATWLAERVAPTGEVIAADISLPYLQIAARQSESADAPVPVLHVAAPLETLPFAEGTFDLAWCAQSFYSLPDPLVALRYLASAVRPGGVVAVLENDTLHHVILPWPPELEMAIQLAEYRALSDESDNPRKYYVARRLSRLFRAAALSDVRVRTHAIDRAAPLRTDERTYFAHYLASLSNRVFPWLPEHVHADFQRLTNPSSDDYLLNDPDLVVTCIDRVVWGRRV